MKSKTEISIYQVMLVALGYPLEIDGILNSSTKGAIKMFQKNTALEETGELCSATKHTLKKIIKKSRLN